MEANNVKAMREALANSNGLLEELALIGEWGESAQEQIAENNAALAATTEANNAAALREALEELVANIEMRSSTFGLNVMVDTKTFLDAKAALAAPPRNCDVGSPQEQSEWYNNFCYDHRTYEKCCGDCPLNGEPCCELAWAQMPYEPHEEGGAK